MIILVLCHVPCAGKQLAVYQAYSDALGVRTAAWDPSGQFLAVGSYDQKVRSGCTEVAGAGQRMRFCCYTGAVSFAAQAGNRCQHDNTVHEMPVWQCWHDSHTLCWPPASNRCLTGAGAERHNLAAAAYRGPPAQGLGAPWNRGPVPGRVGGFWSGVILTHTQRDQVQVRLARRTGRRHA